MGRSERRSGAGNVVLALPDSVDKSVEISCRCIRTYYASYWQNYLSLRGVTFLGVARAYDKPDKNKPCIWYEMLQFGMQNGVNPLWSLDLIMRESAQVSRDMNLRSTMQSQKVESFASHGIVLASERVNSLKSGIESIEAAAIDYEFCNNMTRRGAILAAIDRIKPDILLQTMYRRRYGADVSKAELTRARLLYAASPEAYIVSDVTKKELLLADYFNWARSGVVGVELEKI